MSSLSDLFVSYKQLNLPKEKQEIIIPTKFNDYLDIVQLLKQKKVTSEESEQKIEEASKEKIPTSKKTLVEITAPTKVTTQFQSTQEWYPKTITSPDKEVNFERSRQYAANKLEANAEHAFNYFVENGLSHAAAAGIVGNLWHEDLANPGRTVNDSRGTTALGIAGFNSKGQLPYLQAWCKQRGLQETDFDAQLGFLVDQVKTNKVKLSDPNLTPEQASFIFGRDFEKFAGRNGTGKGYLYYDDAEHVRRRNTAIKIFNKYGNKYTH